MSAGDRLTRVERTLEGLVNVALSTKKKMNLLGEAMISLAETMNTLAEA